MKTAIDPFTKEKFVKTRNNQVYANRSNQINHNNEKARNRRKSLAFVSCQLQSNLKIIENILGENTSLIKSHEYLLGAGFNFGCITHLRSADDQTYYCVYNVGYRKITPVKIELKSFKNEQ